MIQCQGVAVYDISARLTVHIHDRIKEQDCLPCHKFVISGRIVKLHAVDLCGKPDERVTHITLAVPVVVDMRIAVDVPDRHSFIENKRKVRLYFFTYYRSPFDRDLLVRRVIDRILKRQFENCELCDHVCERRSAIPQRVSGSELDTAHRKARARAALKFKHRKFKKSAQHRLKHRDVVRIFCLNGKLRHSAERLVRQVHLGSCTRAAALVPRRGKLGIDDHIFLLVGTEIFVKIEAVGQFHVLIPADKSVSVLFRLGFDRSVRRLGDVLDREHLSVDHINDLGNGV